MDNVNLCRTKLRYGFRAYNRIGSMILLAHNPWHARFQVKRHLSCPISVLDCRRFELPLGRTIFILNLYPFWIKSNLRCTLWHQIQSNIENSSMILTCARMIGPPCHSNNFSLFIISTIIVVNFCIASYIFKLLKKKKRRKEKKKKKHLPQRAYCLSWKTFLGQISTTLEIPCFQKQRTLAVNILKSSFYP